MRENALTLAKAWSAFDAWMSDPRVDLYPEPRNLDAAFRATMAPFMGSKAPKAIGDALLSAFSRESGATLVTFDRALASHSRKFGGAVIVPA